MSDIQYQELIQQVADTHPQNRITQQQLADGTAVAVKRYDDPTHAQREYHALQALRDFGINIAPQALYVQENYGVMEWLNATALTTLPNTNTENPWHKMMAALGASGEMDYARYTQSVPMLGTGCQNPLDLMTRIDTAIEALGDTHPHYDRLVDLTNTIGERLPMEWQSPPPIGLCRQNYALDNFLDDGYHTLTINWEHADWSDMAAEVGLWSAHPDYETIPVSHWSWVRWEFARLTKDQQLPTRATIYGRLGLAWWAVKLATDDPDGDLCQRYLARAEKTFSV